MDFVRQVVVGMPGAELALETVFIEIQAVMVFESGDDSGAGVIRPTGFEFIIRSFQDRRSSGRSLMVKLTSWLMLGRKLFKATKCRIEPAERPHKGEQHRGQRRHRKCRPVRKRSRTAERNGAVWAD